MSGRKKGYDKTVYHSFAMIMQFGINMLVPICALSALGIFIDKKLGTSFVMIILFFVGAAAGARNIYRMAKYSMNSTRADAIRKAGGSICTHDVPTDENEQKSGNSGMGAGNESD